MRFPSLCKRAVVWHVTERVVVDSVEFCCLFVGVVLQFCYIDVVFCCPQLHGCGKCTLVNYTLFCFATSLCWQFSKRKVCSCRSINTIRSLLKACEKSISLYVHQNYAFSMLHARGGVFRISTKLRLKLL